MFRPNFTGQPIILLALIFVPLIGSSTAKADPLDTELLSTKGKEIYSYLQKKNCKVVGVLPFQTQRGRETQAQFNPTPLSMTLVPRLERALTLLCEDNTRLRVVQGCGTTSRAARLPAWTHAAQRARYFQLGYAPAWGTEKTLSPDVFLVGVARLSPDWKTTQVVVQAFHADAPTRLTTVCTIEVPNAPALLASHGVSFRKGTKGVAPTGRSAELPDPETMPGDEPEPQKLEGFDLEILYSGKVLPREQTEQSQKELPKPVAGDRLSFNLKNSGMDRLIVLLRVNGRNLFDQETDEPEQCLKFIVKPGETKEAKGYIMRDPANPEKTTIKEIVARIPEEIEELQSQLDQPATGTIEVFVYRESEVKVNVTRSVSLSRGIGTKGGKAPLPKTLAETQKSLLQMLGLTSRKGINEDPVFSSDETNTAPGVPGPGLKFVPTREKDLLLYECYRYRVK